MSHEDELGFKLKEERCRTFERLLSEVKRECIMEQLQCQGFAIKWMCNPAFHNLLMCIQLWLCFFHVDFFLQTNYKAHGLISRKFMVFQTNLLVSQVDVHV